MASFHHHVVDAQFVELPMLDEEFDITEEPFETLVVYDAFGGIKHTIAPTIHEVMYE